MFTRIESSRRRFLATLAAPALAGPAWSASLRTIAAAGPGAKYQPRIEAAFVRRKGPYGMLWPGEIFDGEAALKQYRGQVEAAAADMGLRVALRPEPLYSIEEARAWLGTAAAGAPDGLLIILLDRQQHAWPTAVEAVATKIPTVIFSPVGAAFTTNTAALAGREGVFVASTSDFRQCAFGLKMLRARAKLREMRFVVLKGNQRRDAQLDDFGTRLRWVPAREFLEEYNRTNEDDEIRALASEYLTRATRVAGPSRQDVINGVKSYVVARRFLEREQGDGITMDCLGALGATKVSLPCISWATMLDHGIPAACEADLGAAVTHALVQNLFDRPGFQQDPVPETARECLIGAHCTCPTRLAGFNRDPVPYYLSHHHGRRDAVPVPQWRVGERVTVADVMLRTERVPRPRLIVSAGAVTENVAVPPAGGCVVSVMVELDGKPELLGYPGFHQLFFYGDFKRELKAYANLTGMEAQVV